MIAALVGTKLNMASKFNRFGHRIPVTNIMVDSNIILRLDENKAVIGFRQKKAIKKTENAYVKVAGYMPRFIKEVRFIDTANQESPKAEQFENTKKLSVGDKITVSIFEPGDQVKITGITKGKGFAGAIKRWGFRGGPKTHGQSDRHRAPGSLGAGTTPGRVFKGKKMAGHMGASKLTVTGLEVIDIDTKNNLLIVKGAVPGPKNGLLIIEKTGKVKGYTPPPPPNEGKQAEKEAREEKDGQKATENQENEGNQKEKTDKSQVNQNDQSPQKGELNV